MSTADDLYRDAFAIPRCERSEAYKKGVIDALRFRLKESPALNCPFHPGIAQADAWFSGTDEGNRRARDYLRSLTEESYSIPAGVEVAADERAVRH